MVFYKYKGTVHLILKGTPVSPRVSLRKVDSLITSVVAESPGM